MLLTNLIFEPRGKHDPALAYSIKDTVMSADGSRVYFALQDVPAGIALSDEEYWKLQIDLSASKTSMDNAIADFANYAKMVGTKVRGETAKVSGNPVTFLPDTGSLLQPVTVLEPQQEGSGDPSPENIRPFIGYDKLGLNHAGKNLLNIERVLSPDYKHAGITGVDLSESTLTLTGTPTITFTQIQENKIVNAEPLIGKTLTLSGKLNGNEPYFAIQFKSTSGTLKTLALSKTGSTSAVVPEGTTNIALAVCLNQSGCIGTACTATYSDMQLEIGSTASDFQPYTGTLRTVQVGQTVYGIRYEWLTGKAWIEWSMKTLDGTEAFTHPNWMGERCMAEVVLAAEESADIDTACVCSHFRGYAGSVGGTLAENAICIWTRYIYIRFQDGANGSEAPVDYIKAYLAAQNAAGTPVQVCWKLAQPIEIQLTPHIISAVEPEQNNTLYGDGSIEVEYVKPLHVSIEERVAAALAAATE